MNCIRCGYCSACPVYRTEPIESISPRGKLRLLDKMKIKDLDARLVKDIYKCSLCGLCEVVCQAELPLTDYWERVREELVNTNKSLPTHKKISEIALLYGNPYGAEQKDRTAWLSKLDLKNRKSNTLYFAGCMASFRLQKIAISTADILDKLGIEFSVGGSEEYCCGSPFLRTGFKNTAEKFFEKNFKVWSKLGVERIITSCPGCYKTISRDYPEIAEKKRVDFNFEVLHITTLLDKELNYIGRDEKIATFHDPCHLGRHMKLYEEPRRVIKKSGFKIVEMERNREYALCCGAGGGLKTQFKEISITIGRERIMEAKRTTAELLLTSCPFCVHQLSKSSEKFNVGIKVLDIVEAVNSVLSK
ncbi:MAG: (Fe-S)-binding protein [Archaeoglobales archaeon]|nr:(Fe-S)-binding protein [Archaeoglobales archaeon]